MTEFVIFDCDGVLVDTEPIANRVLAMLLTDAGLTVLEVASRSLGRALPNDISDRYYLEVDAAFRRDLGPVTGVMDALDRIRQPSCVASSGIHHRMRLTLSITGLWDRFDGRVFSATDVEHGKPAPDLFLYAAGEMGFDPAAIAVFVDSVPGVQAARAAGIHALAYTGHTPADELVAAGGHPLDSMGELPALLDETSEAV